MQSKVFLYSNRRSYCTPILASIVRLFRSSYTKILDSMVFSTLILASTLWLFVVATIEAKILRMRRSICTYIFAPIVEPFNFNRRSIYAETVTCFYKIAFRQTHVVKLYPKCEDFDDRSRWRCVYIWVLKGSKSVPYSLKPLPTLRLQLKPYFITVAYFKASIKKKKNFFNYCLL